MAAVTSETLSGPMTIGPPYVMSENAFRKTRYETYPNLSLRESPQCELGHDSLRIEYQILRRYKVLNTKLTKLLKPP